MVWSITGGAGFIGSNLARRLVAQGREVRVFDNFSTGKRGNLNDLYGKVEVVEGDLRDFALVMEAMEGTEVAFHLAALPSVFRSVKAPATTNEVNVTGTLNVLQAARARGVRRVIYASSSSVYGDSAELPKQEAMVPNPISPYAVSKLAGEYYCQSFSSLYSLETVVLRYFNVYGPYQDPTSEYSGVIAKFITSLLAGESVTVYGDGEQSRDFTFVEDVLDATILAATCSPRCSGMVFNVARGQRASLRDLIRILGQACGRAPQVVYEEPRPGDVRHSEAQISKIEEMLSFRPKVSLEEGLRRTVEWYRSRNAR